MSVIRRGHILHNMILCYWIGLLASVSFLLTAHALAAANNSSSIHKETDGSCKSHDSDFVFNREAKKLYPTSDVCRASEKEKLKWKDILDYCYNGVCALTDDDEIDNNIFIDDDETVVYEFGIYTGSDQRSNNSLSLESFRVLLTIIGFASFSSLIISVVSGIYSSVKKHKFINPKSKLFEKNGGLLLEQFIADHSRGPQAIDIKIFTSEELNNNNSSNNNNTSRSLGPGACSSNHAPSNCMMEMVFVEKVLMKEGQIERFINDIITVGQFNHPNVIKLFGCCLETEAPVLIYEHAPNGTLFDYIHCRGNAMPVHWDILIEIASESAAGLAYLHSLHFVHGNVSSLNILLTDCLAKVAGFGPPRLVFTESHISTLLQRALGYLDPEFLLTGQLTQKSDVYSFGVVLIEILTGEKPISYNRPENQTIITSHFLLSMKQENGLFRILTPQVIEENKEQVRAVAELAKRCIKLSGAERPTMEEVAGELKRLSDTYLTVQCEVISGL